MQLFIESFTCIVILLCGLILPRHLNLILFVHVFNRSASFSVPCDVYMHRQYQTANLCPTCIISRRSDGNKLLKIFINSVLQNNSYLSPSEEKNAFWSCDKNNIKIPLTQSGFSWKYLCWYWCKSTPKHGSNCNSWYTTGTWSISWKWYHPLNE